MVIWLAYCVISLTLSWITILSSHPSEVKHEVHAQDSSRTVIFLFAVTASFVSLFAILILLKGSSESASQKDLTGHILLSLASVISSWALVHTIFTLRYAHLFYCDIDHDDKGKNQKPEGLEFPNEKEPDYLDFTYFFFCDRHDLSGFRCADHIKENSKAGLNARCFGFRFQHGYCCIKY